MTELFTRITQHRAFIPLVILGFFSFFFGTQFIGYGWWISSDSLVYTYPLRSLAWQMMRQGEAPLWTPLILSGYPLLSMSQLALGYPLTWGYAFLPDIAAESVYILAPFLLSPWFLYLYLRRCERSRLAALLGGLSFGYGGFMAGQIAHNGLFPNAVMWLPLFLLMLERAREEYFLKPWLWTTVIYTLCILSGLGQGFLYVGLLALGYGFWLAWLPGEKKHNRWQPFLIAVAAIVFAAGLTAWQTLETWQAQRRSLRASLTYHEFSRAALTWPEIAHGLVLPLFYRGYEIVPTAAALTVLLALLAGILVMRAPRHHWRPLFWVSVALLGLLLISGDGTPLYRLLYHVPLVNKFRNPWRHTYEFTLGMSVLAAWGWDEMRRWLTRHNSGLVGVGAQMMGALFALLTLAVAWMSYWLAARMPTQAELYVKLRETTWLGWKTALVVLLFASLWWAWRRMNGWPQAAVCLALICVATFWESYIHFSQGTGQSLHPTEFFRRRDGLTNFLQQATPLEQRVYTAVSGYFDLPPTHLAAHNLSAMIGVANAAGYEPLMPERYRRAFGMNFDFVTPDFQGLTDAQLFRPDCQVLDLLNVRYFARCHATEKLEPRRKGEALFDWLENNYLLNPGERLVLSGENFATNQLSIVSALANAANITQGTPVTEIRLVMEDARTMRVEMKAGIDTSEWSCGRAGTNIAHQCARQFDTYPGDAANNFEITRFWTMFSLNEATKVREVSIRNLTSQSSLALYNVSLASTDINRAALLMRRLPERWRLVFDETGGRIYENSEALPRVWLTPRAEAVSADTALQRVRGEHSQRTDWRKIALLELPATILPTALQEADALSSNSQARIVSYRANRIVIETESERATALVVSEAYHPGWRATLDGQATKIYPADYLLRGIIVPAGKHRVVMRYTASAAQRGGWIALATLFIGLSVWGYAWKRG